MQFSHGYKISEIPEGLYLVKNKNVSYIKRVHRENALK